MQARYYDPVIGRFYSNDPVGYRDVHSFNRYAYANNNPYKYIDPNGESNVLAYTPIQQGANSPTGMESFSLESREEMVKDLSGFNDAVDAVNSAANGDITGVAVAVVGALCKPCKAAKMQQKVQKGQAPKGIKRFDSAESSVKDSKDHVHFKDGTSMNNDGTIHDKKGGIPNPSNKEKKFLKENNWPTEPKEK